MTDYFYFRLYSNSTLFCWSNCSSFGALGALSVGFPVIFTVISFHSGDGGGDGGGTSSYFLVL